VPPNWRHSADRCAASNAEQRRSKAQPAGLASTRHDHRCRHYQDETHLLEHQQRPTQDSLKPRVGATEGRDAFDQPHRQVVDAACGVRAYRGGQRVGGISTYFDEMEAS
jgi:hypothetical protein